MSDKQKLASAKSEINALIGKGAKISLVNKDTFYLYSTDKKLLATIDLFKDGKSAPKYTVFINGLQTCRKFDKSNNECQKLYNYVDSVYNVDSMLDKQIDKTPFVMSDVQEMWKNARNSKSIAKEQEFLNLLIKGLIQRKCPIGYIQRAIYCFKTGMKHSFPQDFTVLNTMYKLVEYTTQDNNIWFYTGQESSGRFIPMDDEARELFDSVKIALQNQKQHVK